MAWILSGLFPSGIRCPPHVGFLLRDRLPRRVLEGKEDREKLYFHQQLLNDKLPLSIGGGIGQSRLCMVLLHKAHIGEIQASIWPEDMRTECEKAGMPLI